MFERVRVQALHDVQFIPVFKAGEFREYSPTDARALIALGWVKEVSLTEDEPKRGPGRPKKSV
jgi:hypothetical protein